MSKPRKPRDLWGNWARVVAPRDRLPGFAWAARDQYLTAQDLRRLAKWALDAAAYLEAKNG